ncbi:hypothetical protein [Orbus mooreae]|uniref:hypothetical protein n=1 Tax=Orbus mooreae TaxID=3074107 RepID=UPI00370D7B27
MGDKYVSAAELSRLAGVNKQTVSRKIKSNVLVPAKLTESGRPLFDVSSSLKILNEQKDFDDDKSNHHGLPNSQKGGRPKIVINKKKTIENDDNDNEPKSHTERFNKARADKAVFQAKLAEIEVNTQLGLFVHVGKVEEQGSELGSILLNALTNLPDRLSSELSTIDDERTIHALLTKEINSMIIDIRKSLGIVDE